MHELTLLRKTVYTVSTYNALNATFHRAKSKKICGGVTAHRQYPPLHHLPLKFHPHPELIVLAARAVAALRWRRGALCTTQFLALHPQFGMMQKLSLLLLCVDRHASESEICSHYN